MVPTHGSTGRSDASSQKGRANAPLVDGWPARRVALIAGRGTDAPDTSRTTGAAPAVAATASVVTSAQPAVAVPAGVPGNLPDGVYTVTITDTDLAAMNVAEASFADDRGTFTFTFTKGVWHVEQVADPPTAYPTGDGTYVVDGDTVKIFFASADADRASGEPFTWKLEDDGSLVFAAEAATSTDWAAILASHPLAKVG